MIHGLLLSMLVGCGGRERVAWDAVSADDLAQDVTVALLLFGFVREKDRSDLVGPHVMGGQLSMQAEARFDDARTWQFEILEPSIADVVVQRQDETTVDLDILFLTEGTTELFVVNGDGAVLDVQTLRVRAPVSAELTPWEELQAADASGEAPEVREVGTLHTVQGAAVDLALTWTDRADTRLAGGQLLTLAGDIPPRIDTTVLFTGEVDVLRLEVGDRAPVETLPIELLAAEEPRAALDLVVHDDDEVDEVQLEVAAGPTGGAVRARVRALGDELVGAPVTFSWDERVEEGTVLLYADDDDAESVVVRACYGDDEALCDEATVPGRPTTVADREAEAACSCQVTPSAWRWDWLARRR